MGQADIIEYLEDLYNKGDREYYTESEIEKSTGIRDCSTPMRALRKHDEVEYRRRKSSKRGGPGPREYRFKPIKKRI